MSMTGKIREKLQAGPATADDLAERLGVQEYAALQAVRQALRDLEKGGEVVKAGQGQAATFSLTGRGRPERGRKQERLWRAMQIRATGFTSNDLVVLAEVCRDYAKKYLRWLVLQGLVHQAGQDGRALVYRLAPGQEGTPAPAWNRRAERRARKAAGRDACATAAQVVYAEKDGRAEARKIMAEMRETLAVAVERSQEQAVDLERIEILMADMAEALQLGGDDAEAEGERQESERQWPPCPAETGADGGADSDE